MSFTLYLAHGGLGNYDELIFVGVSVIFVAMMGISWIRSRNIEPDFDDEQRSSTKQDEGQNDSDHFSLD